jgi:hypothetical protein
MGRVRDLRLVRSYHVTAGLFWDGISSFSVHSWRGVATNGMDGTLERSD